MSKKPQLHKSFIDPNALGIVENLQLKKHTTYLVGGCVRDLLIGIIPKDFDIATSAKPNEVKRCVPRSYIIGKRFRLVLAKRGDGFFEIATFRREVPESEKNEEFPQEDNAFGTSKEDALRRDFTVNGLFYDPFKEDLLDHCKGITDLENQIIRMIGDPNRRLKEDPIRILRALRLAHKINFSLDPQLRAAMQSNADSLFDSALPRRREELLKFLRVKDPSKPFLEAYDLGVLKVIAPTLNDLFNNSEERHEFVAKLRNINELHLNADNPTELFVYLIHAYVRIKIWPDPTQKITNKMIEDCEDLKKLMKFELGMYNLEQEVAEKALKMQTHLLAADDFKQKEDRRLLPVLKNPAFRCAMLLAHTDALINDTDWDFWSEKYEQILPEIAAMKPQTRRKRRPRRK